MQDELESAYPNLDIDLFAINMSGAGSGISYFTASQHLPVVQDDSILQIWSIWGGVWRDVFILDQNNVLVHTYNLTQYSLSDSANYDTLMQLFIDTATP